MKVYRVELMIFDFDDVGEKDIRTLIEQQRYPNRCISPKVMSIDSRPVEWQDNNPLNYETTMGDAFRELFGDKK